MAAGEISNLSSPIGLIAGNGFFPLEFVACAKAHGIEVVAVAHVGETDQRLEDLVSDCLWLKVGQVGKLINFFKKKAVKQVAFVGGIRRTRRRSRALRTFRVFG
jgi:UDP-2,3-diacylglucosamine hydrolase